MCPDSPAPTYSMWTDGSTNSHTNFAADSGLEVDHCCIKAGRAGWRGGSCSSLLHGVCEFGVTGELLADPGTLVAEGGRGLLAVRWGRADWGWVPSSWIVTCCFLRPLSAPSSAFSFSSTTEPSNTLDVSKSAACITETLESKAVGVIFKKLQHFSEFNVTVTSFLEFFNRTQSTHTIARTLPARDVSWLVTLDGRLKVSWLRRVAHFAENNRVELSWQGAGVEERGSVEGTVTRTEVPHLTLGKRYSATLVDLEEEDTIASFVFTATPNCTWGSQEDFLCWKIVFNVTHKEGLESCKAFGAELWSPTLGHHHLWGEREVWVRPETGGDRMAVKSGNIGGSSASSVIGGSNTITEQNENRTQTDLCPAWSRNGGKVHLPCSSKLPTPCMTDMKQKLVYPDPGQSLRVVLSPNSVRFEEEEEFRRRGWASNYEVRLWPKDNISRSGRGLINMSEFEASRRLEEAIQLEPGVEYSVRVVTRLGQGMSRETVLEEVTAVRNLTRLPYQLVGFSLEQEEYVMVELTVCSLVIVGLAVSIIIFILSQTLPMYTDNVAQVCFQFSLLSCYLITLLTVDSGPLTHQEPSQPLPCLLAIAGLQFFYLCAFTFLLLETLVILHKLVDSVLLPLLESTTFLLTIGFLLPGLYTAATLPAFQRTLLPPPGRMCWLNLSSAASLCSIVPVLVLSLATTGVLLTAIFAAQESGTRPISASVFSRAKTLRRTRFILLLILILLIMVWTSGVVSSHFRLGWLAAAFILLSLVLALVILSLRCLLDTQVVGRIKRAYLKCEEVGEVYEASQHTIITRKPVFPSSAGVCTTVSTVGSSPQNCQIGPEHPKREMEAGKLGREAGKQGNPITIRPGSLTPVELTPPPSAATTRAASLSAATVPELLF